MAKTKTGDIWLVGEKGRCVAYWRPADGSCDVFLCAAPADAIDKHPHLRELLIELAAELALNRSRAAGTAWLCRCDRRSVAARGG